MVPQDRTTAPPGERSFVRLRAETDHRAGSFGPTEGGRVPIRDGALR